MSVYNLVLDEVGQLPETFDLCIDDPSLNGEGASALEHVYNLDCESFINRFLSQYSLGYIARFFNINNDDCRVVSYPEETKTCYEKAALLSGWSPVNVIKAIYFESSIDGSLCAVITPETGSFVDKINLCKEMHLLEGEQLKRSSYLPQNMTYGTCSPFITEADTIENGGRVKHIIFDNETLHCKEKGGGLDDFSFGLNHTLSIQMNYHDCYRMLKERYPGVVQGKDVLKLPFKEQLKRKKQRTAIVNCITQPA